MAKAKVNKSAAIREALKKNKGKTPGEIAQLPEMKSLGIDSQYISNIKTNLKAKKGKTRKAKRKIGSFSANGTGAIGAAVEFIKAAGSLEAAKQALGTVEEIRSL